MTIEETKVKIQISRATTYTNHTTTGSLKNKPDRRWLASKSTILPFLTFSFSHSLLISKQRDDNPKSDALPISSS